MSPALVLRYGDAIATVSPDTGGRLASLVVLGEELLVTTGEKATRWGAFLMAPWVGRLRDGLLVFQGREYRFPANSGTHANHGTVFDKPWTTTGPASVGIDLGAPWPFGGRVEQRYTLSQDRLRVEVEVTPFRLMPAIVGWHPWFRRRLSQGGDAALAFQARARYRKDASGIPDGTLEPPGVGPWDHCFVGVETPPRIRWPGALKIEIASSSDHWVVFTEPTHALCVEPQTGPPNGLNLLPPGKVPVCSPSSPLRAWMEIRFRADRSR